MKRYILIIILSVFFGTLSISAKYAEIEGILYNIYGNDINATATVVPNGGNYRGNIRIPDYVEYEGLSYPVRSISKCAFKNCHELVSIELPSTPKFSIYAQAFANSGLEEITIPPKCHLLGCWGFCVLQKSKRSKVPIFLCRFKS